MLEAIDVSKSYKHGGKELTVLKNVSIKIPQGEVMAIVGPSGAGKSTLLHILGGLDQPTQGTVQFGGEDIYKFRDRELGRFRNHHIGFVFQFYHLFPEFNAIENVAIPAMVKDDEGNIKRYRKKAEDILTKVGLKDRLTHRPQELSGGEQQRVAIARALMNEPKIILCDEPTGNLNSEIGAEIINLLMSLNRENKQTVVMVTHDENIAKRASKIIRMRDGVIN